MNTKSSSKYNFLLIYFRFRLLPLIFVLSFQILVANAQPLSLANALELCLKKHPEIIAADLAILQSQQQAKAAAALQNPEITFTNPTGDFYTIGVSQAFQLPTVYKTQKKLAKQQIAIQTAQKQVTQAQISLMLRIAYLQAQFAQAQVELYRTTDSIYQKIVENTPRQFEAGQITALAKTYAAAEYGKIHNQLITAQAEVKHTLTVLVVYTGLAEIKAVEPLVIPDTAISLPPDAQQYPPDSASLQYHPIIKLHAQNIKLANWQKKLAKKQALPGFSIGYLNPSDKNTSIQNRFSLGLSVPLWWRQYKNNIQAATTQIAIAQQQSAAAQTELEIAQLQIKTQLQQSANELNYYLSSGNQNAAELATMATRFFMAGETDALVYLQTLRDAFAIKVAFLQSINNYQQANLQWQYFLLKSEQ